jgi:hypothetical protein
MGNSNCASCNCNVEDEGKYELDGLDGNKKDVKNKPFKSAPQE